jgi:hypothetical protein
MSSESEANDIARLAVLGFFFFSGGMFAEVKRL